MILLPEQFQMIIYHLVMGWFFGLFFSFENAISLHCFKAQFAKIVEFLFFTGFMLLFYFLLYQLNGGMTHLYCILLFLLGIFIYMKFYLMTFYPFINATIQSITHFEKQANITYTKTATKLDPKPRIKKWKAKRKKKKEEKKQLKAQKKAIKGKKKGKNKEEPDLPETNP